MLSGRSPYEILGISAGASKEDIHRAFRALAREWHPDRRADDPDAHENFIRIQLAYAQLSDPDGLRSRNEGSPEGQDLRSAQLKRRRRRLNKLYGP